MIAISLLVSILIVLIGFLVKMDDLASAESLMKSVGAERIYRSKIHGNDNDSLARLRLFNVCEEMSISSGVSMPSIWVLPKSLDVNAFVAGESPETSAICVTDCALRYLERDELQGSGRCLEWDVQTADKHSTGGVGDKLSLVIQPSTASSCVS